MKPAGVLLSLDEYLDRSFERATELIAGELRPKPRGTDRHSETCVWLSALLLRHVGRSRTRVELSLRIGDEVLIPDLSELFSAE